MRAGEFWATVPDGKRYPQSFPGGEQVTNHQINFLGWILFILSAIGFLIASIGDFWAMVGSGFFLVACLVFLIPFFRKE